MSDMLLLLVSTILVNDFVLTQSLGLYPSVGTPNKLATTVGLAAATTLVLTLASVCTYLVHHYLLPPDLASVRTLTYLLVVAVVVTCCGVVMHKISSVRQRVLGVFLPLITLNCAVLGLALLNDDGGNSVAESVFYGFGAALGFSLALVLFAALRERLVVSDVPQPFKGPAISLITVGLLSLAFMGLAGLV